MATLVPNTFPTKPAARRLAIVGECPGADELAWHVCTRCGHGYSPSKSYTGARCPDCGGAAVHKPTPFVGQSGRLLNKLLAEVGIDCEACFVGNVCQMQPPRNEIKLFKWEGEEIQCGLMTLVNDLNYFKPHMILLLGNTPLRAFRHEKGNISDWRGSLFIGSAAPQDECSRHVKCLATYHPAALLRDYSLTAVVRLDLRRLREELATDALVLPERVVEVDLTCEQLLERLALARKQAATLSVDIEGGVDYVECIGFATGPFSAFVVPFIHTDGTSVWTEDEEVALWQAVSDLLTDPQVPKVLQNSLYDAFVLAWSYGIVIRGIQDDTMLKHHELYCELEKSLGFQTSIYTRQPFYKFQRKRSKELAHASTD